MGVHTIIGLKRLNQAKQRLAPCLDAPQRVALMLRMLTSVVREALAAELGPVLLATSEPSAAQLSATLGVATIPDGGLPWNEGLVHALNQVTPSPTAVLYLAGDLPLLTAAELRTFARAAPARGVAVARARDGGSNALLVRPPRLLVPAFGEIQSASVHAARAAASGVPCAVLTLAGLALDVDTVEDAWDAGIIAISETGRGRDPEPVALPSRLPRF